MRQHPYSVVLFDEIEKAHPNIFNILLILGISSTIHPIAVNAASVWDMYILAAIGILTYVFGLSKKEIRRPEGAVMVLLYFAAMAFAIVR